MALLSRRGNIMTEVEYINKKEVVELLKKLGHRVIEVPGEFSSYGSMVIIHGDTEYIIHFVNGGNLQ